MDGPMVTKFGVCLRLETRPMHITQVMGGVHLRVRTCARADVRMCASLLRIPGTAGRTALKFGVWLGDQWAVAMRFTYDGGFCTNANVATVLHF